MRIGLQGPHRSRLFGGAATFEQELFEGVVAGLREHPHTLVVFSRHPPPVDLAIGNRIEWVRVSWIGWRNLAANSRRLVNWVFNQLLHAPSVFRNEHWIDAYLHQHRVEFFLNLIPEITPTEVPYMVFVWDLMHRVLPFFPECSQRGSWVRREIMFSLMIRRAAIVAVGTEVGKRDVMNYYQVPEDRVHVLHYSTPQFALTGYPAKEPIPISIDSRFDGDYVFYPANFHAHKNHVTLLRALAVLRDHHGVVMHAVLSGGDWGNLPHVKEVMGQLRLAGQVHFPGFVSREELIALYRGARAMVFPSLLGPDNIPPLEAFGLGCPAIVANIPGAEEQMEGAALLFPPTDEQALAAAILKVHGDPEFRNNLVALGKTRAQKFTSKDLGLATLHIIGEFEAIRRCWASEGRSRSRYNVARLFGG